MSPFGQAGGRNIRVLLVEDNPEDAMLIRLYLEDVSQSKFEFEQCVKLDESLERLGHSPMVDIVVLDLALPDSNGLESLKEIHDAFPDMPVVILTGLTDEQTAINALRIGAQDYLVKGLIDGRLMARSILYAIERKTIEMEQDVLDRALADNARLTAIGTTVSTIMHHIKNCLIIMVGNQHQTDPYVQSSKQPDILESWSVQKKIIKDLNLYAENMLRFSKEQKPSLKQQNLNSLADSLFRMFKEKTIQDNIHLRLRLDEGMPDCLFDWDMLEDALSNLMINAIEAVSAGGNPRIAIRTRYIPGKNIHSICVEDNGSGLDESVKKKIFEPFFSTKGSRGTGLGLAVVQKNVAAHLGRVGFDSRPGETRFCIVIPVLTEPVSETTA